MTAAAKALLSPALNFDVLLTCRVSSSCVLLTGTVEVAEVSGAPCGLSGFDYVPKALAVLPWFCLDAIVLWYLPG